MLSPLIWFPIAGALLMACLPAKLNTAQVRGVALAISGAVVLWTIGLFTQFDLSLAGFQMREFMPWLPHARGSNYDVAVEFFSWAIAS